MRRASLLIAGLALCFCQSAGAQGTVSAWGFNYSGQLGNGTATTVYPYGIDTPVPVSGLTGVTAVAGGLLHSLALKREGTVWAWDVDQQGFFGMGFTGIDSNTPVQVLGPGGVGYLGGVTAIAAGAYYGLALRSDGTVWAWGYNVYGQLGNGT